MDLTFGEQVKIILSRKGMTIKELAETIEARTGKKMSRQNLTQRLGRDNFQEQDMRMIAGILGCPFYLNILDETILEEKNSNHTIEERKESVDLAIEVEEQKPEVIDDPQIEREITIGELNDLHEELEQIAAEKETEATEEIEAVEEEPVEEEPEVEEAESTEEIAGEAEQVAEEMEAVETEPVAEEVVEEAEAEETYTEEYAEEVEEEYVPEYTEEYAEDNSEEYAEEYVPEYTEDNVEEYAQEYMEEETEEVVEDLLAEMDAIEQEAEDRKREKETREDHGRKNRGWRSYLSFGKKKHVEEEQDEAAGEPEANSEDTAKSAYAEAEERPSEAVEEAAYEGESVEEDEGSEVIYLDEEEEAEDDGMIESDEEAEAEDLEAGDLNPYTGKEYETNSVRMHPKRIGYVQVYDRAEHKWTDMTEWAFLGYQERKKALLGKDYEPPIYLD